MGHCLGIGDRIAAADKLHPIGLIGDLSDIRALDGHQMKQAGDPLALGTGPAGAEDRPLPAEDLGLNEKIAERRMQRIRGR